MKNKQTIIIVSIIAVLLIAVGITAFLSGDDLQTKKQLNNDAVFAVIQNGEEIASYNMQDIQALGEVEFCANHKSSGNDAVEYLYTGVPLLNILEDAGISLAEKDAVIVSAIDGYVVSVSADKVLDTENVYIAYMKEGEPLGTREDGGDGPYQLVISKDKFSQYWCKYAYSVEIK